MSNFFMKTDYFDMSGNKLDVNHSEIEYFEYIYNKTSGTWWYHNKQGYTYKNGILTMKPRTVHMDIVEF